MALCDLDKAKRVAAAPAPGKSKRKRVQMKRRKARQAEAAAKAKFVGAYSCASSHAQNVRAFYIVLISRRHHRRTVHAVVHCNLATAARVALITAWMSGRF